MKDRIICCFCGRSIEDNEKNVKISVSMDITYEDDPIEQFLFSHLSCLKSRLDIRVPLLLEAFIDE